MKQNKPPISYIYLHGFASSPNSAKAQFVKAKMKLLGHDLVVPDLNQNDFLNLTLTRQLDQVIDIIRQIDQSIVLIGSSMGGLIATILADQLPSIQKLVLLAPAFQMPNLWDRMISDEIMASWQRDRQLLVFHYGMNKELPLNYNFITDLHNYNTSDFKRQLPSLIIHGIHDEIVPIEYSQNYIKTHTMAQLIALNDDHSLELSLDQSWELIEPFLFN